jgi:apolipoprotein N-acyltransferase
MLGAVATVVSGFLYSCAFPTASLHVVAWVALVPWLLALRRGSSRGAAALAWLWAVVASYGLNDWFPRAVSTYYLQPAWIGAAFFLGVASFTAAPAFVAFALVWRRLLRSPTSGTALLAAAAWVAAELVRARVLRDPWALLGYSQVPAPVFLQVADVAGVYGTSFVLATVNATLALCCMRSTPRSLAIRAVGLALLLAVLIAGYGVSRARTIEGTAGPATPIAIVQANLDLGSQWRPEFYGANLETYLRMTRGALRRTPTPRVVVWPESALSFFLDDEPLYRAAIATVLAPTRAELVTGGPRTERGNDPPYHNTTFLLEPDGVIRAWYDKRNLLPFAEEFPLGSVGLLRRHFGRVREFTPGEPTLPLPTAAGPVGVVVCNEALFAEPARDRVLEGASILFALANDSWVGEVKYAEQATAMTTVRAIEERRWLVRASTSGPSAVIAPSGRVVSRTEPRSAAVISAAIARSDTLTPYARFGDVFAFGCAILAITFAARRL